ncbi:GNAT family N-acetyltransferase [Aerococcaceae bacterium zg-BR9]|uniref:GNAT family N-acetyltransferase n=1 Tax=Aerococcaceae bacterium zg-1292 TaxID=2774330 RepID=UPI004064833E|nr:GNAT family N-acetyltransferase [Aerococcaceae bacterium zg-BR9]MBF6977822.1 GNAT family N-acetyltransferase [Aerococcaceae bacterium zg-BR22]
MVRIIDDKLSLIPYYRNDEVSLTWYQDIDICKQIDNMDELYNLERLHRMYDYLCEHGDCYYIQYQGQLIGDVSLLDDGAIAIVICKAYQNRQIGRRCVLEMLQLAYEKGLSSVKANIYSFNRQSQKMFLAAGFRQIDEEWYEYSL